MAQRRSMALLLVAALLVGFGGVFSGCGGEEKTKSVVESPEAKAADKGVQNGMQDYMKSKTQKKKK